MNTFIHFLILYSALSLVVLIRFCDTKQNSLFGLKSESPRRRREDVIDAVTFRDQMKNFVSQVNTANELILETIGQLSGKLETIEEEDSIFREKFDVKLNAVENKLCLLEQSSHFKREDLLQHNILIDTTAISVSVVPRDCTNSAILPEAQLLPVKATVLECCSAIQGLTSKLENINEKLTVVEDNISKFNESLHDKYSKLLVDFKKHMGEFDEKSKEVEVLNTQYSELNDTVNALESKTVNVTNKLQEDASRLKENLTKSIEEQKRTTDEFKLYFVDFESSIKRQIAELRSRLKKGNNTSHIPAQTESPYPTSKTTIPTSKTTTPTSKTTTPTSRPINPTNPWTKAPTSTTTSASSTITTSTTTTVPHTTPKTNVGSQATATATTNPNINAPKPTTTLPSGSKATTVTPTGPNAATGSTGLIATASTERPNAIQKPINLQPIPEGETPNCSSDSQINQNVSIEFYKMCADKSGQKAQLDMICGSDSEDIGWTVIQRRGSPLSTPNEIRVEFVNRKWSEYVNGFGNTDGDFWIGLSTIAAISRERMEPLELRIDLGDWNDEHACAAYTNFSISDASDFFRLQISGYRGNAGDALKRHDGMAFSTLDMDNDMWTGGNCASRFGGGWWYNNCHLSNLNGAYLKEGETPTGWMKGAGIIWWWWKRSETPLKTAEIKIRYP